MYYKYNIINIYICIFGYFEFFWITTALSSQFECFHRFVASLPCPTHQDVNEETTTVINDAMQLTFTRDNTHKEFLGVGGKKVVRPCAAAACIMGVSKLLSAMPPEPSDCGSRESGSSVVRSGILCGRPIPLPLLLPTCCWGCMTLFCCSTAACCCIACSRGWAFPAGFCWGHHYAMYDAFAPFTGNLCHWYRRSFADAVAMDE